MLLKEVFKLFGFLNRLLMKGVFIINMRLSTKEQEELVLKNLRLVPYCVKNFSVPSSLFNDLVSIGQIGLIKAAITFDKSKNVKFATYASRCINNEILMYFRKDKSLTNEISMSTIINEDKDGSGDLTLEDVIASNSEDLTEQIYENEEFIIRCIDIVLNLLNPRETSIILYRMAGLVQHFIAQSLNISQSYVSRIQKKARRKIKQYSETGTEYNKVFQVKKDRVGYQISFNWEDISQLNKILARTKVKLKSEGFLPEVRMKTNGKRVMLNIFGNPEDFYLIAEIIRELNKLKLLYSSTSESEED